MNNFSRRLMMQKRGIVLPEGYTQLEYITNSGTGAYINTGIVMKSSYNMIIDFIVSAHKTYATFWGGSSKYALASNGYNGCSLYFGGKYTAISSTVIPLDTLTRAEAKDGVMTINGNDYASGTTEDTSNFFLLRANYNDGFYAKNSVYYFKVCDGDTVLMELIPARQDSDSVVGMIDLVSNKFFKAPGGTITGGPEV